MIKPKKMKSNNNERNKNKAIFIQRLKILSNDNRNKHNLRNEFNTINNYTTKDRNPIKIDEIRALTRKNYRKTYSFSKKSIYNQ